MSERVRVGVGIIVMDRDRRILLGMRLAAYNNGLWSVPAGHVELGETFGEAAMRELYEETGLKAKHLELVGLNNYSDSRKERQYVNIDFLVQQYEGSVQNAEPDLCAGWEWFPIDNLPTPVSDPTKLAIRSLLTGSLCVTEHEGAEISYKSHGNKDA